MTEYTVMVTITERREVVVHAATPQEAAVRAEGYVRQGVLPAAKVKADQVDYYTTHGGESHWYPE
jgi:hypothetical protein